ncbi:hypothetical protein OH77DRAFT_1419964 [Trametes cingulata]|nr:hypothetical protein OH77DRAFT_1419964 [Trametes cingulata]
MAESNTLSQQPVTDMAAPCPPSELHDAFCPPSNLPVSCLLQWPYTPQRPGTRKFALPPQEWLSKEEPTITKVDVEGILLPPSNVCQLLPSLSNNALSRGFHSVQHPIHPESLLPLWIIPVWSSADELLRMQQLWRERLVWIETMAAKEKWAADLAKSSRDSVLVAPWKAGLPPLQRGTVSAAHLAQTLLSNRWLDDEVIDCLGDVFSAEMKSHTASQTLIATAHLRTCLAYEESSHARYYSDKLTSGTITRLLLPCNIRNLHCSSP